MNPNKPIVPILIGIVLIGLGVLLGYGVGKEQAKLTGDQNTQSYIVPRANILGAWTNNAAGNVTEITPTSISIEGAGEELSASLVKNIQVTRKVLDKDNVLVDSPDVAGLSDVKVGDFVNVIVSANDKGELTAQRMFLIPIPPGTPPSSQ